MIGEGEADLKRKDRLGGGGGWDVPLVAGFPSRVHPRTVLVESPTDERKEFSKFDDSESPGKIMAVKLYRDPAPHDYQLRDLLCRLPATSWHLKAALCCFIPGIRFFKNKLCFCGGQWCP